MPLVQTRGAASAQGFGEFAQVTAVNYIEDVFSTYLYTGTASTLAITNGIDLSANGGLVWVKRRNSTTNHVLVDNSRPLNKYLASNLNNGNIGPGWPAFVFNNNGFNLPSGNYGEVNTTAGDYVSWTFREQPKFFDVVTYTGNGADGRNIAHSLGAMPACIIVKRTDSTSNWSVYHHGNINGSGSGQNTYSLNTTGAANNLFTVDRTSSTNFNVSDAGAGADSCNANGATYVAYLFASNAGGFGLTGTDNVISCGSFTTNASGEATVNLGYEPQWVMYKPSSLANSWNIIDTMRGYTVGGTYDPFLRANAADAEYTGVDLGYPTATGFYATVDGSATCIYIAIRRGPMKVPTLGTSVFTPIARTGTGAVAQITGVGFPPDLAINADRTRSASANTQVTDRLRGTNVSVFTNRTDGDLTYTNAITAFGSDGETLGTDATQGAVNVSGNTYINWLFRRAPGFFDVICYTGTGSALNPTHNLGVTPELKIIKSRSGAVTWIVGGSVIGGGVNFYMFLETNAIVESTNYWSSGSDSATTFSTRAGNSTSNSSGQTYVAYLFATCAGVSKVGSYTGNGSSQTINCGFTGGARFVMVKATSTTGNWIVADSARGIVAGNDPALYLNSTAAEVTGLDWIDADNSGFVVNETATIAANTNGVSYIFLAIA